MGSSCSPVARMQFLGLIAHEKTAEAFDVERLPRMLWVMQLRAWRFDTEQHQRRGPAFDGRACFQDSTIVPNKLTRALGHRQPSPVYTCMSVQNDGSAGPGDDAHVCTYAGVRSHLDLYT